MSKLIRGAVFAGVGLTSALVAQVAPAQVTSDRRMFFKPYTKSQTEILQRATSDAIGNLAWESVTVSDVKKVKNKVQWTATTRSNKYFCNADPDGQESSCERP